jgi:hypothetical protein
MKVHRRTAAWTCAVLLVLSLAGWTWHVTRPAYLLPELRNRFQSLLAEGWEVEIDAVDYDVSAGLVRVEGLRLYRDGRRKKPAILIPRAEFETRVWALAQLRLTDVRISDPEVVLERSPEGRFSLEDAFKPGAGGEGVGGRPHIHVQGGSVRFEDESLLAAGEAVRLDVESIDWAESPAGKPSAISAVLTERGSAAAGGAGALGRVVVGGDLPLSPQGIHVAVEKFEFDQALRDRLSDGVKEQIALVSVDGTFGEGPDKPGLQFDAARGKDGPSMSFTLRPRGVNFLFKEFPLLFRGLTGDAIWKDGALRLDHFVLYYDAAEFHVNGSVERIATDARCDLQFWARNFYLDRALRRTLPPSVNRVFDAYDFAGVIDVTAAPPGEEGSYDSWIRRTREGGPLELQITARLADGEMSYRGYVGEDGARHGFDWPLTGITGQVSVTYPVDAEGAYEIFLRDVVGRRGDTVVTAHGSVKEWPKKRAAVDILIEAGNVPLDDDIRAASPAMERIFRRWSPRGKASRIQVHVQQVADVDHGAQESVIVELDGKAGFTYDRLPVPLDGVSGTIRDRHPLVEGRRASVLEIDAVQGTTADGSSIAAGGTIEGDRDPRLHVRVDARALFLNGAIETALRERKDALANAVAVWDRIRPTGPVDAVVEVTGTESKMREVYRVGLRGGAIEGWGDVKFAVAGLEGTVDVTPEAVRLRGVRGLHDGRDVVLDGTISDPGGTATLDLRIDAAGVALDASAREILGPVAERLEGYFATVKPKEGLRGDASVHLTGPAQDLEAAVRLSDLRGGLAPFDLRDFTLDGGAARYEKGVVTLEGLQAAVGDRRFTVDRGRLDLDRKEGELAIVVRRLRFPQDLVGILAEDTAASLADAVPDRFMHSEDLRILLSKEWRRVEMRGPASLSPRKEGSTGGLELEGDFLLAPLVLERGAGKDDPTAVSGTVDFTRGALHAGVQFLELEGRLELGGSLGTGGEGIKVRMLDTKGRVEGRELSDTSGDLLIGGGHFLANGIRGTLARGQLGASVEVGGERGGYEVKVSLVNAGARSLFAPADPESKLLGQVSIDYRVGSQTGKVEDLGGHGRVDIANARLLEVPVFLRLFSFLNMQEAPVFDKGRLVFDVVKDRLSFSEIELDSPVLGLHKASGQSSAWMDGRLAIKLTPDIKAKVDPSFLIKPFVGFFNMFRIFTLYVGGTIQNPTVSYVFLGDLFIQDAKGRARSDLPPWATPVDRRPAWDF